MLYGAWPGTETLKLSVPHQNPGGASPASASAWPGAVTLAAAAPALVSTSARPAARASQVRFMMPPVDSWLPIYDTMCDRDGLASSGWTVTRGAEQAWFSARVSEESAWAAAGRGRAGRRDRAGRPHPAR